jgi:hypothetical protein
MIPSQNTLSFTYVLGGCGALMWPDGPVVRDLQYVMHFGGKPNIQPGRFTEKILTEILKYNWWSFTDVKIVSCNDQALAEETSKQIMGNKWSTSSECTRDIAARYKSAMRFLDSSDYFSAQKGMGRVADILMLCSRTKHFQQWFAEGNKAIEHMFIFYMTAALLSLAGIEFNAHDQLRYAARFCEKSETARKIVSMVLGFSYLKIVTHMHRNVYLERLGRTVEAEEAMSTAISLNHGEEEYDLVAMKQSITNGSMRILDKDNVLL